MYLLGGSATLGKGLVLTYRQHIGLLRRIAVLARAASRASTNDGDEQPPLAAR